MFHKLYETPVVFLRLFMVYGPEQKDVGKLVPYVTLSLLKNQSPQLTNGHRLIDWIYIDDVVNAYLAAATMPNIIGMTFDIGSGKLVPIREVVYQLIDLIKPSVQPNFGSVPDRPFEQELAANIDRGVKSLGWQPFTSLAKGLAHTVSWYRDKVLHRSFFLWTPWQVLVEADYTILIL
jgi:nucleoside-diphosphate-sugar epimerase